MISFSPQERKKKPKEKKKEWEISFPLPSSDMNIYTAPGMFVWLG